LVIFILAANFADIDYLLYLVSGRNPVFIHQYFTHNLLFVLVSCGLLSLLVKGARSRWGVFLTGMTHLGLDIIVIDTLKPFGFRLFFPFSNALFNIALFPYLRRGSWPVILSWDNLFVLGLEFACFVLPVIILFRRRLEKQVTTRAFWKL
jgi:membrane-bound metal-dependent hydrolase YbcI (DUF457 family)